ncbi:O-antigen ligase family protein [candidate division KSB1 bacterium]|nr:O-antigen ligase family protein [candidate division KSB1 bacterium]
MITAAKTFAFERKTLLVFLLAGGVSLFAGAAISIFSRISYSYLMLAELSLFIALIVAFLKQAKRFLIGLMIITIPINVDKSLLHVGNHIGGVPGLVVSVWSLLLFSLYIIWIGEYLLGSKKKIHSFPIVSAAVGFLVLFSILSMAKSISIKLSVFQLVELIKVIMLMFYIANNVDTEKDYKFIIYTLFAAMLLEISLGYYQHTVNQYVDLGIFADGKARKARELGSQTLIGVTGTFFGDGPFADYLLLMLFLVMGSIISKGKIYQKVLFFGLFGGGLPLLIFTFSRGAWLGFVCALGFFVIVKLIVNDRRSTAILFFLLIAIAGLVILYSYQDIIFHRVYGDDRGSAQSRLPMMRVAFEILKANPLLGVGLNNYTTAMAQYDPTGLSYIWHQPVHNVFMQLAAEIGIPGISAFILLILALFGYAIITMRRAKEFYKNQLIGLLAGLLGLFIHGMVNNATIVTSPYLMFWLWGGLILSIAKINQQNSALKNNPGELNAGQE